MSKASPTSENTPYVPDITLDRSSPVPLYFQISEPIAQLINSGALPADTRLEDELSMAARLHVSRPTARQARPANAQEADVLKITEGTLIVHIERTRFANDEPIAVLTNFIPTDIAPTMQELESASLYDLMRERGVTLASARQVIGARSATTKEAKLLSEHRGAALLTTQRTTYDPSGRIVEYGDHIYRASRYSFEASLFAQ